jgi:glucose-1-phosphate thymidylyltransferase
MKGIVLAGGTGSRLWPSTLAVTKQLLPVYDKPMIYYPISTLMLADIREILLIVTPEEEQRFRKLLGDGSQFGINLSYAIQSSPKGLAEAFLIGEEFIGRDEVCLILGDNLFYGSGLGRKLSNIKKLSGAHIFGYQVSNPSDYGVLEVNALGGIEKILEKPIEPKTNLAVPGLYFYPNDVIEIAKGLKPSQRGELEITDLNQIYLANKKLTWTLLERTTVWLDTGTHSDLFSASSFVEMVEARQGIKIACLEEIALGKQWISLEQLRLIIENYGSGNYARYLRKLLEEKTKIL